MSGEVLNGDFSMLVMRVIGLATGEPTVFDFQFLKEYDPTRDGVDPNGRKMLAHIVTTKNLREALRFKDLEDLHKTWTKVDSRNPVREDGCPNRPLTAFTVEVVRVEDGL